MYNALHGCPRLPILDAFGLKWRRSDSQDQTSLPDPVSIPYYAPADELPTTLPTTSEIENCKEELGNRSAVKVVALGPHFVVKYGKRLKLDEGRMMIFVRQCTQIPVPRVFALYHDSGQSFIVMERIHGQPLHEVWQTLDNRKKEKIAEQMHNYLGQLRRVKSPGGYCSLGHQPMLDPIFSTSSHDCDGPFKTEMELNDALIRKCRASDALKNKADFYQQVLPHVLRGHPPVLTHGDIQKKNIMVRSGSAVEIVLIDWESAGWYPSYWEYANTIYSGWFENDWYRWVDKFLHPFPNEYAWFAMLAQELAL